MGNVTLADVVKQVGATGAIASGDVLALRQHVFGDGVVGRDEAEAFFTLDAGCKSKCPEWSEFFVEALTDYIVHQEKPHGHVSVDNADWLVGAISRDGVVQSATELELLVRVLEAAKSSPEALSAYALCQVAVAVIEGKGPIVEGHGSLPGVVDKAEVDLLRRILYAFGGDGNIAITRPEAEVLLMINDRTVEEMNDPSWNDLYVKAIASFVMSASGYEAPSREEALRRDAFFDHADADIGGFFSRMVSGGVSSILEAYTSPTEVETEWQTRNAASRDLAARAERVDAAEARWLVEKIGGDRLLHDNERELLSFIKRNAREVHPELRPLIDRVA